MTPSVTYRDLAASATWGSLKMFSASPAWIWGGLIGFLGGIIAQVAPEGNPLGTTSQVIGTAGIAAIIASAFKDFLSERARAREAAALNEQKERESEERIEQAKREHEFRMVQWANRYDELRQQIIADHEWMENAYKTIPGAPPVPPLPAFIMWSHHSILNPVDAKNDQDPH